MRSSSDDTVKLGRAARIRYLRVALVAASLAAAPGCGGNATSAQSQSTGGQSLDNGGTSLGASTSGGAIQDSVGGTPTSAGTTSTGGAPTSGGTPANTTGTGGTAAVIPIPSYNDCLSDAAPPADTQAVFVSASAGNDGNGRGTALAPFKTIALFVQQVPRHRRGRILIAIRNPKHKLVSLAYSGGRLEIRRRDLDARLRERLSIAHGDRGRRRRRAHGRSITISTNHDCGTHDQDQARRGNGARSTRRIALWIILERQPFWHHRQRLH